MSRGVLDASQNGSYLGFQNVCGPQTEWGLSNHRQPRGQHCPPALWGLGAGLAQGSGGHSAHTAPGLAPAGARLLHTDWGSDLCCPGAGRLGNLVLRVALPLGNLAAGGTVAGLHARVVYLASTECRRVLF